MIMRLPTSHFPFYSLQFQSPALCEAEFHILFRFNFSVMFRSNEVAPNAQLDSPFPVLSSLLQFPKNDSFALMVISRVIFAIL
jgi:hypothetical protein